MLNLQDWLDEHESPRAMGGAIMYVRSDDLRTLVDQIRLEQAASVPQGAIMTDLEKQAELVLIIDLIKQSQAAQYLQTVEPGIIIHTTA